MLLLSLHLLITIGYCIDNGTDALVSPQIHFNRRRYHVASRSALKFSTLEASSYGVSSRVPPSGEAQILSNKPLIYTVPDLLSPAECQALIDRVETLATNNRTMARSNPPQVSLSYQKLWPLLPLSFLAGIPSLLRGDENIWLPIVAFQVLASLLTLLAVPLIRVYSNSSSRTSDAMSLNQDSDVDESYRTLVDRVSRIAGNHLHWEAPVVTKYEVGAIFGPHNDASPNHEEEWKDLGGQRQVTCILYLNTVKQGGETQFLTLKNAKENLKVAPQQGKALIFFPSHEETLNPDDETIHESCAATEEVKWIVQLFGRTTKVPSPLGLPDKYFT